MGVTTRRFVGFAFVSGIGLTLDVAIYTVLCASGAAPELANLLSAATAVTFVFFAASRRVFSGRDGWMLRPFAAYVAYQVVAITAASVAIGALTDAFGGRYLLAKAAVLPVTLAVNFIVAQRLLSTPPEKVLNA